jgi:3D (Asp-Asp-Asp) domain-containing protein
MLLPQSLRRKLLAILLGAFGILLLVLFGATVIDSRPAAGSRFALPGSVEPVQFVATAYCKGQTTASGVAVRSGVAAADPRLLPLGSVVLLNGGPEAHQGIYTVLDTGPKVRGRHVDLYMWSCHEALAFGRRSVSLTVLRKGWHPNGEDEKASSLD